MMHLYAIFDNKAEEFGPPFTVRHPIEAERHFSNAVNRKDPNNVYNTHPQDFDLYKLGSYDPATGETVTNKVKLNNGQYYTE